MVVASDVKNIDDMLLIPSGTKIRARHIEILQAWGVRDVQVEPSNAEDDTHVISKLPQEIIAKILAKADGISAEVRADFWETDEKNPVFQELLRLLVQRRLKKVSI